ncbi:restriction endonuclease [Roseobacter sinensis]|uniref:Restriction endonuclease n=1 Tax=Roseobacter sinensis TaxID=2931391 RepID=A0ABT3BD79_9RHOB|nr:restriction endonuclease [Roseobacter sp. WL0113]MCV3271533.1 restriction endonuclease [Roseobacter sp. WL0113]
MALTLGISNLNLSGSTHVPAAPKEDLDKLPLDLILPTEILELAETTSEGSLIRALAFPWLEILNQLENNPDLIHDFSQSPRKFEEFVAASYEKDGFSVTLTPQSGDGGKDVIAEKKGFGAFRIIDQCKAFCKGRAVSPNDVRAMMGTLYRNTNASKAVITTTSVFAPSVADEWKDYMPNRLELRDKTGLIEWLQGLKDR